MKDVDDSLIDKVVPLLSSSAEHALAGLGVLTNLAMRADLGAAIPPTPIVDLARTARSADLLEHCIICLHVMSTDPSLPTRPPEPKSVSRVREAGVHDVLQIGRSSEDSGVRSWTRKLTVLLQ